MADEKKPLGKLEKRILYELDRDAMQTLGEIGKKINKSPQYVEYWIRKFIDEGYIKNFIAVIDYKRLGYTYYHTYHSLRGMSPKMEDEFGRYDIDVAIFAKDPLELYDVMSKINEDYGNKIGNSTIETHVGAYHFGRRYLYEEAEPEVHVPITGGPVERMEIDEEEIRLISALKENARASTIELADVSGLTPDVVRYRLKKLKESKIFLRATFLPGKGYPYRFY
ncbi:MAG: winged helix-turn-helix transcriptional regulator, partial [Candidatus Micrarchaeia archaeon]